MFSSGSESVLQGLTRNLGQEVKPWSSSHLQDFIMSMLKLPRYQHMVDPKQPRSQAFGSAVDVCTNGTVSFQHVATYKSGVSHSHCTLSHFVTCPHVHMSTWTYHDLSVLAPLNHHEPSILSVKFLKVEFHQFIGIPAESR